MTIEFLACNIKDIDQNLDILEDVVLLTLEELLHEKVLTTAIPETQH